MSIISQDPVLFAGSLRFNLDPSENLVDDALWAALQHVLLLDLFNWIESTDFIWLLIKVGSLG